MAVSGTEQNAPPQGAHVLVGMHTEKKVGTLAKALHAKKSDYRDDYEWQNEFQTRESEKPSLGDI